MRIQQWLLTGCLSDSVALICDVLVSFVCGVMFVTLSKQSGNQQRVSTAGPPPSDDDRDPFERQQSETPNGDQEHE